MVGIQCGYFLLVGESGTRCTSAVNLQGILLNKLIADGDSLGQALLSHGENVAGKAVPGSIARPSAVVLHAALDRARGGCEQAFPAHTAQLQIR